MLSLPIATVTPLSINVRRPAMCAALIRGSSGAGDRVDRASVVTTTVPRCTASRASSRRSGEVEGATGSTRAKSAAICRMPASSSAVLAI